MFEALRPKTNNHLIYASVLMLFLKKTVLQGQKKEIVIHIFFQVTCSLCDFKVSIGSIVDIMWLMD